MRNDFAAIIISHKRPECSTYRVLREYGYTGKVYVVIDDGDPAIEDYKERYGDGVKVFRKEVNFDIGDNFDGPNSIATFSRNYCWTVAEVEGLNAFLMLDDDLEQISYRYVKEGHLKGKKAKNLDWLFDNVYDWLMPANMGCISFGNAMDYIGGAERLNKAKRAVMNAFFFKTERRFEFCGRYSEDVISPLIQNKTGNCMLGHTGVQAQFDVWTAGTPKKDGGCQTAYRDNSSFNLRFYNILWNPDCVYLKYNGAEWIAITQERYAYPMIISERHRK